MQKSRLIVHGLFLSVVFAVGCKHRPEPIMPAPPVVAPAAKPDQIAEGEVLETADTAFGLVLPERMKVTKRLYNNVVAVGTERSFDIAAYVRRHVDGTIVSEPGKTSFLNATVREPREAWNGTLRIDVIRRGETTVLEIWGDAAPKISDASDANKPLSD